MRRQLSAVSNEAKGGSATAWTDWLMKVIDDFRSSSSKGNLEAESSLGGNEE